MKIYDISQEVFGCTVYPGDDAPKCIPVRRTDEGELYNLTNFSMCAHNGTHIDAPFHFFGDGRTVERIPLEKTVGECFVASFDGVMRADDAENILARAANYGDAARRILIRGDALVTDEAARVFAASGIYLIGVESQSVGDANAPMSVHKILLSSEVVLLEGVRLENIADGAYFLFAAPLSLGGCDGAPCRAVIIEK